MHQSPDTTFAAIIYPIASCYENLRHTTHKGDPTGHKGEEAQTSVLSPHSWLKVLMTDSASVVFFLSFFPFWFLPVSFGKVGPKNSASPWFSLFSKPNGPTAPYDCTSPHQQRVLPCPPLFLPLSPPPVSFSLTSHKFFPSIRFFFCSTGVFYRSLISKLHLS